MPAKAAPSTAQRVKSLSKQSAPLNTAERKEADATLGRFEANFRLIEQGVLDPPPDGADVGTYIVSAGKLGGRPSRVERVKPKTLADLFDGYLAAFPKGAKEATTWKTERIHIGHVNVQDDRRAADAAVGRA